MSKSLKVRIKASRPQQLLVFEYLDATFYVHVYVQPGMQKKFGRFPTSVQ